MAWTIGANSNSPPFAPAVGANAIPVMRAALFVGIFGFLGAVLQGGSISDTVGNDLVAGVSITPLAAASALLTASTLIVVGNRRGYPIPAAFSVTGAVVGVGMALGGDPAYGTYRDIGLFWLSIPVFASLIGFATAVVLRRDDVPESVAVPLLAGFVGAAVANMRFEFVPSEEGMGSTASYVSDLVAEAGGGVPSLAGYDAVAASVSVFFGLVFFVAMRAAVERSLEDGVQNFLVLLGALVVFSAGGSQVGLATGPLERVFADELGLSKIYLLFFGASALLVGAWMGAPRVVQAVSREYSQLGIRRSISALVPSFLVTQAAITLGLPISANQIVISSIVGSGLVEGSAGVSRSKIGYTVVVWLVVMVTAAFVGYGLYSALSAVTGVT
ncbi:MAG: inorganic phosphate transporter [Halobacteriales archaeon]